jgi:Protein of unknown function (DUF2852)
MKLVLLILAFAWWWPVGLAALGFFIVRKRRACGRQPMFAGDQPMNVSDHRMDRWEHRMARAQDKVERVRQRMERSSGRGGWFSSPSASGNAAFDDYRTETLRRLEDEQREFKDFLGRLRVAKDRAEFDQFMSARRQPPVEPSPPPPPAPQG